MPKRHPTPAEVAKEAKPKKECGKDVEQENKRYATKMESVVSGTRDKISREEPKLKSR